MSPPQAEGSMTRGFMRLHCYSREARNDLGGRCPSFQGNDQDDEEVTHDRECVRMVDHGVPEYGDRV